MSNLVTQAEYARHRGVSRKTVTQWKREGILVMNGSLVDRSASDRALQAAGQGEDSSAPLGNSQGNAGGNTPDGQGNNPTRLKPVPTAAVNSVRETLQESGQPSGPGGMTFMQAKTADMVLRAQLRKLELEERKNSLIDREKNYAHIFRNARQFRDAVMNWPARVVAEMAAELEIDPHTLQLAMEQHLRQLLQELADAPMNLE